MGKLEKGPIVPFCFPFSCYTHVPQPATGYCTPLNPKPNNHHPHPHPKYNPPLPHFFFWEITFTPSLVWTPFQFASQNFNHVNYIPCYVLRGSELRPYTVSPSEKQKRIKTLHCISFWEAKGNLVDSTHTYVTYTIPILLYSIYPIYTYYATFTFLKF